jgi:hypothetical protein
LLHCVQPAATLHGPWPHPHLLANQSDNSMGTFIEPQ